MGDYINSINEIPLLTVLLVTYNHVNSFERAMESVLSQRTNFSYQIIVLDDASSDGTSDIVRKYLTLDNVTGIIREKNIGATLNIYEGLKLVNTKYYAILETDDYWCDDDKLQIQVDILEKNPDCSFCAHNTLINYSGFNKTKEYIKSKERKLGLPTKKISRKYYIDSHISSRVFRTACLNFDEVKDIAMLTYDVAINFYFLTKGKLYYIDRIMSVYNYSSHGAYSGVSSSRQHFKTAEVIYKVNKEYGFKYNYLLARFFALRLSINWFNYLKLRYFKDINKLDNLYKLELEKFKSLYLTNRDIKPILHFQIPISPKKRIVFEIRREKERA